LSTTFCCNPFEWQALETGWLFAVRQGATMWIELGIFVLVIAFALWQIHDVKQERRKREARQAKLQADADERGPG
jgi:ABC-type nickel/cobalt efflux system permease component RcnA